MGLPKLKTKLSVEDLLAPLDTSSDALQSLKRSAKILARTSDKDQPLPVPLPRRAQDRIDRNAAYDQTKEEVDKWQSTMKRIREV